MTAKGSTSLAQRDRALLLGALGVLVALSWWYLFNLSRDMTWMMQTMGIGPWSAADFLMMFLMWAVMMVGMMVPTAVRTVMIFAQISNRAKQRGKVAASAYWFTAGYIMIWTGFSVGATLLQWAFDQAALTSPMMILTSPYLGAFLLISAGAWQLSPIKDKCLRHCRSPAMYIATHFRPGIAGAINLGVRHGLYCLGCCWLLMGLLFVGGIMNFLWIAAISGFILAEKLSLASSWILRVSGGLMIGAGVVYLIWASTN